MEIQDWCSKNISSCPDVCSFNHDSDTFGSWGSTENHPSLKCQLLAVCVKDKMTCLSGAIKNLTCWIKRVFLAMQQSVVIVRNHNCHDINICKAFFSFSLFCCCVFFFFQKDQLLNICNKFLGFHLMCKLTRWALLMHTDIWKHYKPTALSTFLFASERCMHAAHTSTDQSNLKTSWPSKPPIHSLFFKHPKMMTPIAEGSSRISPSQTS